jgi:hypothetical protein
MPLVLSALKTELNTDPTTLGYATDLAAGSTQALANMLNLVRDGTNGGPEIIVRRNDLTPNEVLEAIDSRDFELTPNAAHVAWLESVTQLARLRLVNEDGTNTRVLGNLKRILLVADTQGSRARLDAIANRQGSRAEQLFGVGTIVTSNDVTAAINLP